MISAKEGAPATTNREVLAGKAEIRCIKGAFEQLPTTADIIDKLAALKMKPLFEASIITETGGFIGPLECWNKYVG